MDTRYSLMNTLEPYSENNFSIDIMDSSTVNWNDFKWEEGYIKHYITANELLKPYYLSVAYFGTVAYEYILLELNGIEDIEDVPAGSEIWIPKFTELQDFIKRNVK